MAKKKSGQKSSKSWSAEQAGRVLDEIEAAGMTDSGFAQARGLKVGRLAWWRHRLGRPRRRGAAGQKRKEQRRQPSNDFVEITARPAALADAQMEVKLRNGRSVLLPVSTSAQQLALLLDAIEGHAC